MPGHSITKGNFSKAAPDMCGFVFLFTRRSRAVNTTPTTLAERENFTSEAPAKRLHKRLKGASSSAVAKGYGGTSKQGFTETLVKSGCRRVKM